MIPTLGGEREEGEGQGLPLPSNITLEFSDPSVSQKILHYASARARPGRVVGAPNPKRLGISCDKLVNV